MSSQTPAGRPDRAAAVRALSARIAAVPSDGGLTARVDPSAGGSPGAPTPPSRPTHPDSPAEAHQQLPPAEPGGTAPGEEAARARDIVYRQLAAAPRPRAALARKLGDKGISEDVTAEVLDRFERSGLIDDRVYAELYVAAKHRDRALGRQALRAELRRQGVAEADFQDAVAEIDGEAEATRAADLVRRRIGSAMAAGSPAARRRLLGLLARRGYPASLAARVVEEAVAGYPDAAP